MANPSLSKWAYLCSAFDKVWEANATGLICAIWDSTAPNPYMVMHHRIALILWLHQNALVAKFCDVSNFLASLKASSWAGPQQKDFVFC